MSNASVTSSNREKELDQLVQEIESVKSLNSSLQAYVEHIHGFKKNLIAINENCKQLSKVNKKWIETINMMK